MRKFLGLFLCILLGFIVGAQTAVAVPYQVEVGDYIHLTAYNSDVMAGVMTFDVKKDEKVYGSLKTFCLEYNATTRMRTDYLIENLVEGSWDRWGEIAYLYYNWGQGALGSYTQSNLQRAFWHLNGEVKSNNSDVLAIVGYAISGINTGWNNEGRVMLAVNGGQDVLVSMQPVPEPATMLLLGTGLVGLAGVSRKKFKK